MFGVSKSHSPFLANFFFGVVGEALTWNPGQSCASWSGGSMSFTDTSSSWIWSMKQGSAVDSNDQDEQLPQHDDMGTFNLDLTQGTGGSSLNPFVSSSSPAGTGTTAQGNGATATSVSGAYPTGFSGTSAGASAGANPYAILPTVMMTHGIIMGSVFGYEYPLLPRVSG
jgi:hypothetical protein